MSTRMRMKFAQKRIVEKFGSQSNFAQKLGVSRRTLFNWIQEGEVPSRYIMPFFDLLKLSGEEEAYVLNNPEVKLIFRGGAVEQRVENLASAKDTVRTLFNLLVEKIASQQSFVVLQDPSLENVVRTLRGWLDLKNDEPASLNFVLGRLNYLGVPVIIFPFDILGMDAQSPSRKLAFTAHYDGRTIIFLDIYRRRDEALFDLMHELAHLVSGHQEDPSKEEEAFCNVVAEALIYPAAFLKKQTSFLELLRTRDLAKHEEQLKLTEYVESFCQAFDWSGEVLPKALVQNGHLGKCSFMAKYLLAIGQYLDQQVPTLAQLYFSKFERDNYDSLVEFFKNEISHDPVLFKGFHIIKTAAAYYHLSYRRLAEILHINPGDADELVKDWNRDRHDEWLAQYENVKNGKAGKSRNLRCL